MADAPETTRPDYRSTVFLPRTDFPMKAGLPQREPALLERWERMGLYRRLRQESEGRPLFILHDGPPYANGHIHIGTASLSLPALRYSSSIFHSIGRPWQSQPGT